MPTHSERTEKPTPRRRQRAREEGRFAYSQELSSAVTLAVALTTLFHTLGSGQGFRSLISSLLQTAANGPASEQVIVQMVRQSGIFFLATIAPVLGAAAVASLAGSVVQGLPIFSANATGLKWDHLNPARGLSRLKARLNWMEWIKILLLVAAAAAAFYATISQFWPQLITLPARDMPASTAVLRDALLRLSLYIVGTALVLAVGDYFLKRWQFEKSIMMTKEEVKEDLKAMDGNPLVKGKVRAIQREQAKRSMMARIKDADVIVTNPTHYAVVLEYKPATMAAPKVVAKGADLTAQTIKETSRKFDIPTVENVPLARALYRSVDLEQEIPLELYKAVAEVLAYGLKTRNRL